MYEPVLMVNPALQRRAAAAQRLLPELDPESRVLLLSYEVWPTEEMLAAERLEPQPWSRWRKGSRTCWRAS